MTNQKHVLGLLPTALKGLNNEDDKKKLEHDATIEAQYDATPLDYADGKWYADWMRNPLTEKEYRLQVLNDALDKWNESRGEYIKKDYDFYSVLCDTAEEDECDYDAFETFYDQQAEAGEQWKNPFPKLMDIYQTYDEWLAHRADKQGALTDFIMYRYEHHIYDGYDIYRWYTRRNLSFYDFDKILQKDPGRYLVPECIEALIKYHCLNYDAVQMLFNDDALDVDDIWYLRDSDNDESRQIGWSITGKTAQNIKQTMGADNHD